MVKVTENGVSWHEPPYTEAEEDEMMRIMESMPVMIARAPVKKAETAAPLDDNGPAKTD